MALSEEKKEMIIKLVESGMSKNEACRRVGIKPHNNVMFELRGIKRQTKRSEIEKMLSTGIPPKEVASKVGCSLVYAYEVMRRNGIEFKRGRRKISPEMKERIINLLKLGNTMIDIYMKTGISPISIRKIKREMDGNSPAAKQNQNSS